jgi:hypothetical protein
MSDTSGPAYPHAVPENFTLAAPGKTLRDWFAGQALIGLLATQRDCSGREIASDAYTMADHMLEARKW